MQKTCKHDINTQIEPHREKTGFLPMQNKGTDQLRSNCEADQRLCFGYTDSIISLLLKSEISSFLPASVTGQVGLCQTCSETPKTGFLAPRLNYPQTLCRCIGWVIVL